MGSFAEMGWRLAGFSDPDNAGKTANFTEQTAFEKGGKMAFVNQLLLGKAEGDTLTGGGGKDNIAGNDGDDILYGGGGSDMILGGKGFDYIHGGTGADILHGGAGNDYLFGGAGADYLSGDVGADTLDGGLGADIFAFNVDAENLGSGVDRVKAFVMGQDAIAIVNGSTALVSFVDEGSSVGLYYDGEKIAVLLGVHSVPADPGLFFGI